MRRRTLLATAGVLLSAGCSEIIPDPRQPETDDATTDRSETTTDAPPSETPRSTETITNGTDSPAEQTETTEPPTEVPDRRTARHLDTARSHLGDALDAYVAAATAESPTLLDVTAEVAVVPSDVINPVDAARGELTDLPRDATESQRATADQLLSVGAFLAAGARCQSALADAHGRFEYITDRLYAGNTGGIRNDADNLRSFYREARRHLDTLEAESDAESTAAFDRLDSETYTAKVAQLRASVTVYGNLAAPLLDLRAGFEAFGRGASAYDNDSYTFARREFSTALENLGPAEESFRSLDTTPVVAETVEQLAADAAVLSAAVEDFDTAAAAGERGRSPPREAVENGKEHLRATSERIQNWNATRTLLRQ